MCWNFQSSLIAWIIATVTGIYLLSQKQYTMGILILTYSSMQLWEALMWLDQKCGNMNKTATILAYFALWSHVLAIGIGLYLEQKVKLPLMIGLLFILLAFILLPKKWDCSLKQPNKHLKWGFDPGFYLLIFAMAIILLLFYMRPMKKAILISSLFIVSFVFSLIWSGKYETVGSFWCWVAAAFSFVFLLTTRQ